MNERKEPCFVILLFAVGAADLQNLQISVQLKKTMPDQVQSSSRALDIDFQNKEHAHIETT
jgi:hypothetical protein